MKPAESTLTCSDFARLGRLAELTSALEAGADPNAVNSDSWSPFFMAARHGQVECLRALIDHGAQVNHRFDGFFYKGYTALMIAIDNAHIPAARLLIESGADPFIKNRDGYDAIGVALARQRINPGLPLHDEVLGLVQELRALSLSQMERASLDALCPERPTPPRTRPRV